VLALRLFTVTVTTTVHAREPGRRARAAPKEPIGNPDGVSVTGLLLYLQGRLNLRPALISEGCCLHRGTNNNCLIRVEAIVKQLTIDELLKG
jgi:hypothetical protein